LYKEQDGFKPCPFCGRSDKVVVMTDKFFYELQGEYDAATLTVRCERCRAELNDHSWKERNYNRRVAILRRKWNKRVAIEEKPKSPLIPVTERLPEEKRFIRDDGTEDFDPSKYVLVQLPSGYMKVSRYWTHSRVDNSHPWLDLDDYDSDTVVAWMPLPEAYKEEGEKSE